MRKINIVVDIVLFAFITLVAGCSSGEIVYSTYYNQQYNYTVEYPESWKLDTSDKSHLVIQSINSNEELSDVEVQINVSKLEPGETLTGVVNSYVKYLKTSDYFRPEQVAVSYINDNQVLVEYVSVWHDKIVYQQKGDKVYSLLFKVQKDMLNKYSEVREHVFSSFYVR